MRLYNQTRNRLEWSMHWAGHMQEFSCEPFGPIELDDALVEHCKGRGLPLEVTPMSPEQRATTVAEEAEAAARADELTKLKTHLADAKSAVEEGRKTVERMQLELSESKAAHDKTERLRVVAEEAVRKANADRAAAEKLLDETARKLTEMEERAMKAEAQIASQNRPAKKSG